MAVWVEFPICFEGNLYHRGHRGTTGEFNTDILVAPVRHDSASFRLGTRVVNTSNYESLVDFCRCHLECFKHFWNLLFETERAQNATRVHLQRRDRPDRNHRASAAVVGRTGHCGTWPLGASPHL